MITVYADVHEFAPHAMSFRLLEEPEKTTFLVGDCVDLKNTRKKDCKAAHDRIKSLRSHFGKHYVSGNHELGFWNLYHVHENILFTHGDYLLWGEKRAFKFRSKKSCKSKSWKRFFISMVQKFRGGSKKPSKKARARIIEKAVELDCKTVIMGHKHPRKKIDFVQDGIRIIILPRGRNTIDCNLAYQVS